MSKFAVGNRVFANPEGYDIGLSRILMEHEEGGWLLEKEGTNDRYSVDEKNLRTAESMIPEGMYCYGYAEGVRKICPYWGRDKTRPKQANGCCLYLNMRDWEQDTLSLLWDSVKECGINKYDSEEISINET